MHRKATAITVTKDEEGKVTSITSGAGDPSDQDSGQERRVARCPKQSHNCHG